MTSESTTEILEALRGLSAQLTGLRTEFNANLTEAIGGLRAEFTSTLNERLGAEIGGLRAEFTSTLGEHSRSIRDEIRELSSELRMEISDLRLEMRDEFGRVWDEFDSLRSEMGVGFAALIQKDDRRFVDHEGRIRRVEEKTGLRRRRPT